MRRLAGVVSLVMCGLLAFAATTVAFDMHLDQGAHVGAKGGPPPGSFFMPAGNYHNTSVNAFFDFSNPSVQLSITVSDMTNVANPLVGPSTSTHEIDVSFNACDFTTFACGGGCFIPDGASDFTFASDLSSARLNTTVQPTTAPCQNNPILGFTPPFTIKVQWSGGASGKRFMNNGRYACSGYTSETMTTSSNGTNINATATASFLTGTLGPTSANINVFDQRIHAQGAVNDACPPLGGKGAGPGPLAPGDYRMASKSAFASFFPNDPSQGQMNLFVTTFTNVSHPNGGAATTQSETDLNISQFSFSTFLQACYVIPATAFSIGSQAASVHMAIDSSTPTCPGQVNTPGLPASFTVDATWTGTPPPAAFMGTSTSTCGTLHFINTTQLATINALADGGITGVADAFQTDQASVGSDSSNTHIAGKGSC